MCIFHKNIFITMKHIDNQYTYKKEIGFTEQQRKTFEKLKKYKININQFVRQAVKEKIERDKYKIKESAKKEYCPF